MEDWRLSPRALQRLEVCHGWGGPARERVMRSRPRGGKRANGACCLGSRAKKTFQWTEPKKLIGQVSRALESTIGCCRVGRIEDLDKWRVEWGAGTKGWLHSGVCGRAGGGWGTHSSSRSFAAKGVVKWGSSWRGAEFQEDLFLFFKERR